MSTRIETRHGRLRAGGLRRGLVALALLACVSPVLAHSGDHDAGTAAVSNGPARLPDGSVFLPKPAQRQMGVRTTAVAAGALPRTVEMSGLVMMDPNAGGRVQPTQAGRIEPGPRGLPSAGQPVRQGEVLAYVVPSVGSVERANQSAQLMELRAARALAEKRLARLTELADTVPRKEIELAASELASLAQRANAIGGGLASREALVAPVSGVIASASVVSGQVVGASELLFEVVDPSRMRVEALAYDPAIARDIGAAVVAVGNDRLPLRYLGSARSLRQQALPLMFQAQGAALERLAVGQPVQVFVQTLTTVQGLRVPSSAITRNAANQTVVWVKTAPESFVPRPVTVAALDGVSVAVTAGLNAGERVVTTAATLINQIR